MQAISDAPDRRPTPSQCHIPVSICVDRIPAFRKSHRHHVYRRVSHCIRIEKAFTSYGRGGGVGPGRCVGAILGVGVCLGVALGVVVAVVVGVAVGLTVVVAVALAVALGVAVDVAVGDGPACAQYLPPVLKTVLKENVPPPHTIIWLALQTAV